MIVIDWEEGYKSPFKNTVLTIGNFDGVHLGHQAIFRDVVKRAGEISGTPAVMTFNPHPQKIFRGVEPPIITRFDEKLRLIEPLGIEVVFVAGRTRDFYRMRAEEFIEDVLVEGLSVAHVVVGNDFTLGRDREGGIELLREMGGSLGFGVDVQDEVKIGGVLVKSTVIRDLIAKGDVYGASILLGREFGIRGRVSTGASRGGSLLGFPTANVVFEGNLIPANGVYVVHAVVSGKRYGGVCNLGENPTFGDVKFAFEVHILDFEGDIYGEEIEVSFVTRIRDEVKFKEVSELVARIEKDVEFARGVLDGL
ncbi:MAG: bifunctional riboflavin kinase/FAD synthetase [Deltaproteobacteria bacterium]|uniref:Riboflavin biosynthesis protein n=1 Tax=Candidatus Zymogenus saltonus TaxID=2844893 RepID=A0A9D8KBV8_9DELT|nr:bifunctional riboflavin kinase/FAD synthetase [Candidatus Zymogenus saltonus]